MGKDRQASRPSPQRRARSAAHPHASIEFAGAGVSIDLTFLTPALPDDLDVLSRPLTYIEWRVSSTSGEHEVELYFDASSELVVNTPDQPVAWSRYQLDGQPVLRMGSREQPVLAKRGDDLRIDWGYLYLAADRARGSLHHRHVPRRRASARFAAQGRLPDSDDFSDRPVPRRGPGYVLAASCRSGQGRLAAGVALPDAGLRRSLLDRILPAPRASLVAAQWRGCGGDAARRAPRSRCAARTQQALSTTN